MNSFLTTYWPSVLGILLYSVPMVFFHQPVEINEIFAGFFLGILFHGCITWKKS